MATVCSRHSRRRDLHGRDIATAGPARVDCTGSRLDGRRRHLSLPQNVARSAGPAAALIGWAVSGAGMLMLAFVFQALANRRPDLDTGIYAYAREGFGNYIGFSAAWGYWVASVLGNASSY
jgi:hypothetical protein